MTDLTTIRYELLSLAEMLDQGMIKKKGAARKIVKISVKVNKIMLEQRWRDIKTMPYGRGIYLTYHRDWGYGMNCEQMINGGKPTHWMPLPEPPCQNNGVS